MSQTSDWRSLAKMLPCIAISKGSECTDRVPYGGTICAACKLRRLAYNDNDS